MTLSPAAALLGLALAGLALVSCAEPTPTSGGGDCTSRYVPVATAPTYQALQARMLTYGDHGRVASIRVQDGSSGSGYGHQPVVRVVDLLDARGRRLAQVDVWHEDGRSWEAGIWSRCID